MDLSCWPNSNVSWCSSEIRVRLVPSNMFKPFSNFHTDRFKTVLLLWIPIVICVSCLSLSYCLVCSLQPCGHLLGKGWPLCSRVWCFSCVCHFPLLCPGSGVVFDCIDSCYLPSSLLSVDSVLSLLYINENREKLGPHRGFFHNFS